MSKLSERLNFFFCHHLRKMVHDVLSDIYVPKCCTDMRFAFFLSVGFITAIVVNPSERKLAKRTLYAELTLLILVLNLNRN